jgi:hypothetical protein
VSAAAGSRNSPDLPSRPTAWFFDSWVAYAALYISARDACVVADMRLAARCSWTTNWGTQ